MIDGFLGFFSSWIVYAILLGLHLVIPARTVDGYVREEATGKPYRYRLNGLLVLVISVLLWFGAGYLDIVPFEWLYLHRWSGLAGAVALGLVCSGVAVAGAPPVRDSALVDFFLGRRFDIRFISRRVDAKMFLYLAGATMLGLNILSFASYHFTEYGSSPTVGLYTALFFWFLVDYMVFEHVHLYTYDLVAERVGAKLVFGCLAFYPYFYVVGLWVTADRMPSSVSAPYLVVSAVVFLIGWTLSRGANLQKYTFKVDPEQPFLGGIAQHRISDGDRHVLCGGFWGLSRHINYLGEVLIATGITLALGYPGALLPWLYPLYYVILLTTRQADDDRRCRAKYGELWEEYERKVPWRIIPGLY